MKKNRLSLLALSFVILALAGCIKDKGFDNNEYGIKDPAGVAKGVGFSLALNQSNSVGLDAISSTLQTVNDNVAVNLLNEEVAPRDVKVNFIIDNSIIDKYNTAIANTTDSIRILKPIYYTLPSTFVTIPAGKRLGQIAIKIPTTVPLSLDSTYAIGLRIVSNDGGYIIAENMKTVLLKFSLKNRYDGIYRLKGYHNRTSPDYTIPYDVDIQMITTGPNSVVYFYPKPIGPDVNAHPINGNTGQYYGNFAPNITFDAVPDASGNYPAIGVTENYAGTLPMNIVAGSNSRYEPATKKMYILFRYNANDLRRFYDTLTYKGPRP